MDFDTWVQELRDIPIEDVCDYLGVSRKGNEILCPEHDDRNYGSCKLHHNRYYCFACDGKGDTIGLTQKVLHISWIDAAKWLGDAFGYPFQNRPGSAAAVPRMPFTQRQLELLGFRHPSGEILFPIGISESKPEENDEYPDYRATADGYLIGNETMRVSMDKLYREDAEGFYYLVSERANVVIPQFIRLYEAEIWEFSIGKKLDAQRVLEYALEECKKICQSLSWMDPAFIGFRFPEKKEKKQRYVMEY